MTLIVALQQCYALPCYTVICGQNQALSPVSIFFIGVHQFGLTNSFTFGLISAVIGDSDAVTVATSSSHLQRRHRRRTIPPRPNYSINLWSIMKNCIGKELSKIPMPVSCFSPLLWVTVFISRLIKWLKVVKWYGISLETHPGAMMHYLQYSITQFTCHSSHCKHAPPTIIPHKQVSTRFTYHRGIEG